MNERSHVIDGQLEALLQLVEEYREKRCRDITQQAHEQATTLIKQAHQQARARMHESIQQERTHWRAKIDETRAHLETRQRQRRQQANKQLLQQGWDKLHDALIQRWRRPDQRCIWVEALAQQAMTRLPTKGWRIEHPPGWPLEEQLHFSEQVATYSGGQSPMFVENREIVAGLRIFANGACLDGTLEGLLGNRNAIEGHLLAEISRARVAATHTNT